MNTTNVDTIADKIRDNEPYRRYMTDPRYAAIVKLLAKELIDGWFDETQLTEAVQLASRRHQEYVRWHPPQRNIRAEIEVELYRRQREAQICWIAEEAAILDAEDRK